MYEPRRAVAYWDALMATKTMSLVAIVEILAGLALLLNKYAAPMMIILMTAWMKTKYKQYLTFEKHQNHIAYKEYTTTLR